MFTARTGRIWQEDAARLSRFRWQHDPELPVRYCTSALTRLTIKTDYHRGAPLAAQASHFKNGFMPKSRLASADSLPPLVRKTHPFFEALAGSVRMVGHPSTTFC